MRCTEYSHPDKAAPDGAGLSPKDHYDEHIDVGEWPTRGVFFVGFVGKGGTGKSTLAISLAVALAETLPVTLIDLDIDNGSIARWSNIRANVGGAPIPTVVPMPEESVEQAFAKACTRSDERLHIVVVDLPGRYGARP